MATMLAGAVAIGLLPSVLAFSNTSPFFLFSTADLNISSNVDIASSSQLTGQVTEVLRTCPSRTYFVVRQEGVSSAAFTDSLAAPRLAHHLNGNHPVRSSMAVADVVGAVDASQISGNLQAQCGASLVRVQRIEDVGPAISASDVPLVVELILSAPPATHRVETLQKYDSLLDQLISNVADGQDYTVVYTTSAPSRVLADDENNDNDVPTRPHTYEMEDPFGEAVHMELKRDMAAHGYRRATSQSEGGLFEKYQYFTPGLFMGLSVTVPLFFILLVGLRALGSLEVSYFAFSKEMGPAAQKK